MKVSLLLLLTSSILIAIVTPSDGLLPSLSSSSSLYIDTQIFLNKVYAQESEEAEEIFIAPGASDPNNDQAFVPPQIRISLSPGKEKSTVAWTNDDSITHGVRSDDGSSFDSGPIPPGDTFDTTFDSPGEYGYHCPIHPFRTGVVVIVASE